MEDEDFPGVPAVLGYHGSDSGGERLAVWADTAWDVVEKQHRENPSGQTSRALAELQCVDEVMLAAVAFEVLDESVAKEMLTKALETVGRLGPRL